MIQNDSERYSKLTPDILEDVIVGRTYGDTKLIDRKIHLISGNLEKVPRLTTVGCWVDTTIGQNQDFD